ncbi:helix-turn-helix transcriptional regulator [Peribacillus sp. JNUCC 23]
MENLLNELTEKCWMIKSAFKMDVEVMDEQFRTILHISDDTEPLIMTETRKGMYAHFQKALMKAKKHSFCFQTDSFSLSYFAIALITHETDKGMVIVGPFLKERVTDSFIWRVIKENHLESSSFKSLECYYKSIAYIGESYLALGDVLVNIYGHPPIKSQIITMVSNEGDNPKELQPQEFDEDDFDIKLRYEIEKKLLHFIEVGNTEKALETFVEFSGDFLYRVPGNPLRARKNIAFSYSSILRLAANKGGVAPQYLHGISELFAIKIEETITISEIDLLEVAMTEEYCNAVRSFAMKGHSSVVKQVLMYLNLHFSEPINLQSVADELGFNRTYIAKKFKDEMNMTVIDYIQKKRIDEAVFLIEQGQSSITDISYMVGFSSYNYFCKVFKEVKGMTATEFKSGKRVDV